MLASGFYDKRVPFSFGLEYRCHCALQALLGASPVFFPGACRCLFLARNISRAAKFEHFILILPRSTESSDDAPVRGGLWNVRTSSFRA